MYVPSNTSFPENLDISQYCLVTSKQEGRFLIRGVILKKIFEAEGLVSSSDNLRKETPSKCSIKRLALLTLLFKKSIEKNLEQDLQKYLILLRCLP